MTQVIYFSCLQPYLLKRGTTWNDPTRPETTYNKRTQTTWNNLEQARNHMKRPTLSKKRNGTTHNKQERTWNDLQRTDSNFMERLFLKTKQVEGSNVTKKQ